MKIQVNKILMTVGILLTTLFIQPVQVHATQTFTENPGSSWISLNSTNNSNYLIHNSGDGNNLEFAANNAGVTTWQVLNINKNGTVSIGTSAISGAKFQVNANTTSAWSGRFINTGSDVRLAYPGHGIFVSTTSTGGEYLLQLNRGTFPVFQVNANGDTYLSGTLKAQQVIVKPNVWADYVFESGYQLKTIPELEQYIKDTKHLPNVPSAKEVADKGISLGDMQQIQMEKIEELTLYTIQQDKKIKDLEARLAKLETLIK